MEFFFRYHELKTRLAPFRLKTDFETIKTIATVDALADRADVIHNGNKAGGYILPKPDGIDEVNLMARAEKYVVALEAGQKPLRGRFTEPGISLADHSFIEKDGVLHLFYNRGFIGYDWPERSCDTLGHAVTDNLIDWKILPPVISVHRDAFEDFAVWSPSVFAVDGKYYMIYTGVNKHMAQAMCLATSEDLLTWERHSSKPVYVPGDWSGWRENKWSDCRDPFVFRDGNGTFYLFFSTMKRMEDGTLQNAMGIASSSDLYHWKDEKQFALEGCLHMSESPFVLKHEDRYYLFYTNCGKGTCYAVSDSLLGEWEVKGLLFGAEKEITDLAYVPSCSEVFCYKEKWYISFATRQPGNEQYLELREFIRKENGEIGIGAPVGR